MDVLSVVSMRAAPSGRACYFSEFGDGAAMERGRLQGLDALRGVAALCVVAQHSFELAAPHTPVFWPVLNTINLGRFGVLLFFLISGFVIPPSLERGGVGRFCVNRAFRLLPALWLSIACFAGFFLIDGKGFTAADVLANMAMVARPLGAVEISKVYWSLSFELGFYVFCVALFGAGQLTNTRLIAGVSVTLSLAALVSRQEAFVFPAYLLVGMLIRERYEGGRNPWLYVALLWLVIGALGVSVHAHAISTLYPLPKTVGMLLPLPVFAVVVAFFANRAARPLLALGAASYSIYLFQGVGLRLIPPGAEPMLYPLAVGGVTVAIASVVYIYLEKPAIRSGKAISAPALAPIQK